MQYTHTGSGYSTANQNSNQPNPTPVPEHFFENLLHVLGSIDASLKAGIGNNADIQELIVPQESKDIIDIDMGVLQPLLEDASISDILINGPYQIYVERYGKLEATDIHFQNHQELTDFAVRIVNAVGRKIDPRQPMVDARLADGSRVNVITPPLAVDGISISIRKFSKERITLQSMVEAGTMSQALAKFLYLATQSFCNIIVCGGTGSGKTTLLNVISQSISNDERIVTIEDSAELQLSQPHVVRLETKNALTLGDTSDEVNIRALVKNALRMRPDRIVVGEVRGSEAFDMIQAMNTGHDGSLTTIHANTARDGLIRLENMISMANSTMPLVTVRRQIASAVNFIIHTSRMEDGQRRVTQLSELVGMEGEIITMQDIFKFQHEGTSSNNKIIGTQKWSGLYPRIPALAQMMRNTQEFKL